MSSLPSWSNKVDRVVNGVDAADDVILSLARGFGYEKIDGVEHACKILDQEMTITTLVVTSEIHLRRKLREKGIRMSMRSKNIVVTTFQDMKKFQSRVINLDEGVLCLVKFEE